jgi:succinate dehydrogenase/fumarate reductase cytochrome b subunit
MVSQAGLFCFFLCVDGVGAGLGSVALIAKDEPLEYYVKALKTHPFLTFLVKLSVTVPLTYHYIGGLRHLVRGLCASGAAVTLVVADGCALFMLGCKTWDNVIGHNPEMVKKTGLFLVGATAVISLVAASVDCKE